MDPSLSIPLLHVSLISDTVFNTRKNMFISVEPMLLYFRVHFNGCINSRYSIVFYTPLYDRIFSVLKGYDICEIHIKRFILMINKSYSFNVNDW